MLATAVTAAVGLQLTDAVGGPGLDAPAAFAAGTIIGTCPDINNMPNVGNAATQDIYYDTAPSVFVGGDYYTSDSESEGLLVVNGNANVQPNTTVFNVGAAGGGSLIVPPGYQTGQTAAQAAAHFAVGGNLTVKAGAKVLAGVGLPGFNGGKVQVGGTITPANGVDAGGAPVLSGIGASAAVGTWNGMAAGISSESAQYAATAANSTYTMPATSSEDLRITGDGNPSTRDVVTIPASAINAIAGGGPLYSSYQAIDFVNLAPTGPGLVINVIDDTNGVFTLKATNFKRAGTVLGMSSNPFGNVTSRVLWNLAPSFTTVAVGPTGAAGQQIVGSFFVPSASATVTLNSSTNGRIWANGNVRTLGQGNEQHAYPWIGIGCGQLPVAAPPTPLSCAPGTFFTQSRGGSGQQSRIYRVTASGATVNPAVSGVGQSGSTWGWGAVTDANGLGVAPGGTTAYAFDRVQANPVVQSSNVLQMLRYTPGVAGTGTYSKGALYALPNGFSTYIQGGAVNPLDGQYYFGGYGQDGGPRFFLYRYDPGADVVAQVGYFDIPNVSGYGNGDLAFDAGGNMTLVYAQGGVNRVVTLAAATVTAGSGAGALTIANWFTPATATTVDLNGIAMDASGSMYIQATAAGSTQVAHFDPNTGSIGSWTTLTGINGGGLAYDLGSCSLPGSLTVVKNLSGRTGAGDQFRMTVARQTAPTALLADATTAGPATGLQAQVAGPIVGVAGQQYRIREVAAGSADLATYAASYQCVGAGGTLLASGSGADFTFEFPSPTSSGGPNVTCTFTNTPSPTTLTLVATVSSGGPAATSWTLGATAPSGALAGPSGSTGTSGTTGVPVTPSVEYALTHGGGSALYVAGGPWSCVDQTGAAVAVTADAKVAPAPNTQVVCTVAFATARLTLLKHVVTPSAGFEADAWNVTVTPASGLTLPTETRAGAEPGSAAADSGANTFVVRPGHTYTLTEHLDDPASTLAYRQVALQELVNGDWVDVPSAQITAPAVGQSATYRFVNDKIPTVMLPLTGGASTDAYLISGGLLLTAALALVLVQRRRRASPSPS